MKKVIFKNVAQTSRLLDFVPQAARLLSEEPDKGNQAGRSLNVLYPKKPMPDEKVGQSVPVAAGEIGRP